VDKVTTHTFVHENVKELMAGFRYDAHPMGMLASTVAALSTFYPDAKRVHDSQERARHVYRLIAKIPTLAAFATATRWPALRLPGQRAQLPGELPPDDVQDERAHVQGEPRAREGARRALHPARRPRAELLHLGHAQHRLLRGRPLLCGGGAIGALYGPLHGGANEAVLRMLQEIGSKDKVAAFVKDVKESGGDVRLMGFGHRVYKNYDPRAKIIKKMADQVFEVTGRKPDARHRRSSSSGSPSRTSTSSSGSSTRTWTSTPASSTRP